MKNQVDYFDKAIRAFRDLKRDHPDVELSKHYLLATDSNTFPLSDKELYYALMKHKSELDMNTLSDDDLQRVIEETEDLFTEIEPDEEDEWDDDPDMH